MRADYAKLACKILNMPFVEHGKDPEGNFYRVGTFTAINTPKAMDECVARRCNFFTEKVVEARQAGLLVERDFEIDGEIARREVLTYERYKDAIKDTPKIRQGARRAASIIDKGNVEIQTLKAKSDAALANADMSVFANTSFVALEKERQGYAIEADRVRAKHQAEHDAAINEWRNRYSLAARQFAQDYAPSDTVRDDFTPDRQGFRAYLKEQHNALYGALKTPIPAMVAEEDRQRHTYVTGGTGSGKTELLKHLIHSYVTTGKAGTVIIDPHGDMAAQIARWDVFADDDRLIYVDPYLFPDMTPTLNVFELKERSEESIQTASQQILEMLDGVLGEGTGGKLSEPMKNCLRFCTLILLERDGSTFADLQRFLDNNRNHDLVATGQRHRNGVIREFFSGEKSGFSAPSLDSSKMRIETKIAGLRSLGAFENMVNGQSSFDLEDALNAGKIVVFKLSKKQPEASKTLGKFILIKLLQMAYRRDSLSPAERVPVHVFIDECQNFIIPSLGDILTDARKYGVHLTLAQQVAGQGMSSSMEETMSNNVRIAIGGYTKKDRRMAEMLGVPLHDMQNLKVGEFYIRLGANPALLINTDTHVLGNNSAMTSQQWDATKERLKKYYRPIDALDVPDISPPNSSEPPAGGDNLDAPAW